MTECIAEQEELVADAIEELRTRPGVGVFCALGTPAAGGLGCCDTGL